MVSLAHRQQDNLRDQPGEGDFRLLCEAFVYFGWVAEQYLEAGGPEIIRVNVHTRCDLGEGYRWGIECAFLVDKHQGYSCEHAFDKNWNAMNGFDHLMRLAHLFNTLARSSKEVAGLFATLGVKAAIGPIRDTLPGLWLDAQDIAQRLDPPLRLSWT